MKKYFKTVSFKETKKLVLGLLTLSVALVLATGLVTFITKCCFWTVKLIWGLF